MYRFGRLRTRRHEERGAVAIVVALSLTALLVLVGLVIDFGIVRIDRQADKSAADFAALAGAHGLDGGDGSPHPYLGVCTAVRYLKQNSTRFAGIDEAVGWTDGNGSSTLNGCSDPVLRAKRCSATDLASWARFTWSGIWQGTAVNVYIASGYDITGSGWAEDSLPAAASDAAAAPQACDQIAVVVSQKRKPGLGTLATSSDLATSIRSVARVQPGPGGYAPALLLLKRTGCPVLQVGSIGGGADSWIRVLGKVSTNNLSQPGTIHADTDGSSCSGSGGNWVLYGKSDDKIVAFAAPTIGSPGVPDPAKPGSVTTVAGQQNVSLNIVRDAAGHVYASPLLDPAAAASGTKIEPAGRTLISRQPVDVRYITGIRSTISAARSALASIPASVAAAVASGLYQTATCTPAGKVTAAQLPVVPDYGKSLYIDCGNLKEMPTVAWPAVVFNGDLSPGIPLTLPATTVIVSGNITAGDVLSLPNAQHVYVGGSGGDALTLSGGTFSMHTTGRLTGSPSKCSDVPSPGTAVFVVKNGDIKQTGGKLQMCNTTMVLMGGQDLGCVPTYDPLTADVTDVPAPTQVPCAGTKGTGQLKANGDVDWTAPDQYDVMTDAQGKPLAFAQGAWANPDGPEDLALWTESAADDSGAYKSTLGGTANVHVQGVFMSPNFDPLTISGGGLLDLNNAQFISSSLALNGGTRLQMSVDPNAGVSFPSLEMVGLVR